MPLIPTLRNLRQEDFQEIEVNLGYKVSSRLA